MTENDLEEFHAATRRIGNRARWKPMLTALMELATAVHPDRQSDTVTDGISQHLDNDEDSND